MKKCIRVLSLLLAMLCLVTCFASCDSEKENGTTAKPTETTKPEETDARSAVEDTVPKTLSYASSADNTITFFVRNDDPRYEFEIACDQLKNDTLLDAIHYRNIDVETRLGVKIKTIAQPCTWVDRITWNEILSSSVLTNTGDYDATAFYIRTSAGLAKDNIFYNLLDLTDETNGYLNFEKPWWNQSMMEDLSVGGALFFTGGDLAVSETQLLASIFFNKALFNEKFPEETSSTLYDSVRNGTWTINKMIDYVSEVWEDTNSSGVIDDGDVVGFGSRNSIDDARADTWVYAMGLNPISVTDDGTVDLTMYNATTIPAWETVAKLVKGTEGSFWSLTYGNKTALTTMSNGNQLFAHMSVCDGEGLRESTVQYGVLPLPKYNEEQESYRSTPATNASAIALCSSLTDEKAAMASAVLELLAAESYKQVTPVYYSKVLQGQYSKDQEDAEMFDYILGSSVLCFGYAYAFNIAGGNMTNLFRHCASTLDVQTDIDSNRQKYQTAAQELVDALIEAADKSIK